MAAKMSADSAGLFLLSVGEAPNFYSGFLPSLFTIATFSDAGEEKQNHTKRWIRRGEAQATGMALIVGVATSLIAQSPMPFMGMLIMCAYLLWQYEHALRAGINEGLHLSIQG